MGRNRKGEHRALSMCEVLSHHSPMSWPAGWADIQRVLRTLAHLALCQAIGTNWEYEMWSLPSQVAVQVGKQDDRPQARKRVSVGSMGIARMQKQSSLYPRCTQPRGGIRRLAAFREQLASFCSTWGPEQGQLASEGEMGLPFEWDLDWEAGAHKMPKSDSKSVCWEPLFSYPRGSCEQMLVSQALRVPGKSRCKGAPQSPPHPMACGLPSPISLEQAFCSRHLFPFNFPPRPADLHS